MDHKIITTNGINLHILEAGPPEGAMVILLHGFPEFSYSWRRQIDFLAAAGFRVWAPDQRGYNLSDKPAGIAAYALDKLAADLLGLIDATGRQKVFLVGHDWGGSVAWWAAALFPERIERLVILNVPHWRVMRRNMRQNRSQLRKSWYFFFFQIPWLPEAFTRLGNWSAAVRALRETSRPGTFSAEELQRYRQAWSQPGAYRAMLNWYRAIIQKPPRHSPDPRIKVPTLLIWGAQDRFLGREMAEPSIALCDDGRLVFLEEATHWLQHEEPERVNELVGSFLRNGEAGNR